MKLELKKFGDLLISRPAGHDAALAVIAYSAKPQQGEVIQIDFDGVLVLAPSFMHEFVTVLLDAYPSTNFDYLPCQNSSVIESLKFL